MFTKQSRYRNVEDAFLIDEQGKEVRYKKARLIAEAKGALGHVMAKEDRLDLVAQRYYQDPERYWRIVDANRVLAPEELESEPGRVIIIPSVEG
jgi:nucleoid-associated protein YgaU